MNSQLINTIAILSDTILHHKTDCTLPFNKTVYRVLLCLVRAKKIDLLPFKFYTHSPFIKQVKVIIKYNTLTQQALIRNIYIGSIPSRKRYLSFRTLKKYPSPQQLIVSTPYGILLASEAILLHTGGLLLCSYTS